MTTRDDQTGLMNFNAFTFVVDHVVRRASRAGECATVLSIRVVSGEAHAGSSARAEHGTVYQVARLLRTELRGEDVVARVEDQEFGVALPDTDADGGETVVCWITNQLAEQGLEPGSPGPRVYIGRATFEPTHGPVPAERLLDAARASLSGPSVIVGSSGAERAVAAGGDAAPRRGVGTAIPGRRHLRALRSRDS